MRHPRIHILLLVLALHGARSEMLHIDTDDAFEEKVIMVPHVMVVLFTSKTREMSEANRVMQHVEAALPGLSTAQTDVDDVKAFASEFNVRKRMVPRMLVFSSRARQATVIKLGEGPLNPDDVLAAVKDGLADNTERDADGKLQKLTLQIGGGGSDEL